MITVGFAGRAGILLAHMMDAVEAPGNMLDLPALLLSDLFALGAAARAGALFGVQFVYVGGDGQVF